MTCLIVDESSVVRKVAARILFQLGLTVGSAATGAEALAAIEASEMPDFIFVAATLPDMTGEVFIKTLRERTKGRGPVILASLVEANLGQMTRLKRAGANGFIYKPFDRAALLGWLKPYMKTAA